jgi:hypothetical protein
MAYIGTKPTVGNFQICDAISVVNGQAAYTMQVGSVNVIPQSANHMIVSLNGTIQKPNSSFTVSGSTITFASNLATGDVIDFIQILGDVLDLGVPSDATVTTAKLADSSVSLAKLTATGTKDATTFLRGDNTFNSPSVASLSTASGSAPSYSARAWVNFDGDGTVSVRGSANVSSVTDQGTGDYTVNFSTAMSDTNFSCVGSSGLSASSGQTYLQLDKTVFTESGSAQVSCRGETNNRADSNLVCVGIFR